MAGENSDIPSDSDIPLYRMESQSSNEQRHGPKRACMDKELRKLKKLLRLYFHPALNFNLRQCSINVIYILMFIVHTTELTLLTIQMFSFGEQRSHFSTLVNKGKITLHNLLLEGWDADWETLPYPPAQGKFAVYSKEAIERKLNYAIEKYLTLHDHSLGYYYTMPHATMNLTIQYFDFYQSAEDDVDELYKLELAEKTFLVGESINFVKNASMELFDSYDISRDFESNNIFGPFERFLSITLSFKISSIKFFLHEKEALCIETDCKINFKDIDNTGQVVVTLDTTSEKMTCLDIDIQIEDWSLETASDSIGVLVIIGCCIGLICSLGQFAFGIVGLLKTKAFLRKFFQEYFQPDDPTETDLPIGEYFRFVSIWHIFIISSEILTICGTVKIVFAGERKSIGVDEFDVYMIMLGCGCALAWFSVLRIVRFHRKFRLLLSTVWRAAGDVFAYILCVGIMFVGFFVVGYVVLGPYNYKFSTPTMCLETLSALINGDEIFATLANMECEEQGAIWWFSRIYMWSYISAFTIIVLNLLIAIFMSAYEAIKDKNLQKELDPDTGTLETALKNFLETGTENEFRKSLRDLVTSPHTFDSKEEHILKSHLRKLCFVSKDGTEILLNRPRNLKTLMGEEVKRTQLPIVVLYSYL